MSQGSPLCHQTPPLSSNHEQTETSNSELKAKETNEQLEEVVGVTFMVLVLVLFSNIKVVFWLCLIISFLFRIKKKVS